MYQVLLTDTDYMENPTQRSGLLMANIYIPFTFLERCLPLFHHSNAGSVMNLCAICYHYNTFYSENRT